MKANGERCVKCNSCTISVFQGADVAFSLPAEKGEIDKEEEFLVLKTRTRTVSNATLFDPPCCRKSIYPLTRKQSPISVYCGTSLGKIQVIAQ